MYSVLCKIHYSPIQRIVTSILTTWPTWHLHSSKTFNQNSRFIVCNMKQIINHSLQLSETTSFNRQLAHECYRRIKTVKSVKKKYILSTGEPCLKNSFNNQVLHLVLIAFMYTVNGQCRVTQSPLMASYS